MDGAESALEVLRMTSKRAGNLMSWGRAGNLEAKTAEAKALYEDLLPRMEHELVRQAPFSLYFCCCCSRPPCLYVMPASAFSSHPDCAPAPLLGTVAAFSVYVCALGLSSPALRRVGSWLLPCFCF